MLGLDMQRRDLFSLLAGWGCASLTALPASARSVPRRIDIHYHPITPEWLEAVAPNMAPNVIGKARAWTPELALAEMDRNHIETAICSVSNPGIWFGDVAQGRRLARACNDFSAQLMRDHPGRFGLFAALPLPDIEGSLTELAYAFDVLKADGVGLFTSYGDVWIADPKFAPVFEELNRRKATVYVHPMAPGCCRHLVPGIPAALMEYTIDTSRTILHWIMTKSSDLYPNINMIFSHSGGLFMSGVGRLQILSETQPDIPLPQNIAAEAARLYYEISSSADKVTMDLLRSYVPVSHIVMGTDSPFIGDMAPNLKQFEALKLTDAERAAIERNNALRLMPGLASAR